WPKSWFGGEVSPMYSDIFILYPADAEVNGQRGNFPYGEVAAPTWTSLNGSRVGACVAPGYTGVVFEPLDEYKGDLARAYFYMSTRYYGEDAAWPGSPMTDGAQLLPWALTMMLAWSAEDPVSVKEIERNSAIYVYQHNRNPFVDHPEYVQLVFDPGAAGVAEVEAPRLLLAPGVPNPFSASTTIRFVLPSEENLQLGVYDLTGRLIAVLASGIYPAGGGAVVWDGRDAAGRLAGSGTYFVRMQAGDGSAVGKVMLLR
ncbi:MAG: endonuclease, partial [Candidatus Eisenbacteria bacterium]|nr:endonuclease [Candidatus Eisenbacteria bacterium]